MMGGAPHILIVRLSAIGDVVRVLPALQIIRQAFPYAQIDWAVERKAVSVLEGHPALDALVVFDRPSATGKAVREFYTFCRTIRRSRYDIVLDFHGILKSGLLTGYSGAKQRIGFARPRSQEGSSLVTNQKVRLPHQPINRAEENLLLCSALVPNSEWPSVSIHVPHDAREVVDEFFERAFDGNKRVIAMHVPVDRPEKQWPFEHFAALSDMLIADGRFDVVLTWGPGQFDSIERVLAHTKRRPIVAPETTDLKHYAWLAYRASLYFGGDTGPMHIAAAMGTPVVAVFGGTDPVRHAPFRMPHIALIAGDKPGSLAESPGMLRAVTPQMAYEACVKQALADTRTRRID
ncbi:MAG: glycosyltransferase family 9 protein [Candidatus Hydrogenedentes bacterium]|nr:glycosyltransferase family 9 protein [Candidatus Hydrogenedentota bacterium]